MIIGVAVEGMEVLTLSQTQKLAKKMTILLYGSAYWKEIINFDALVRHGMIAREDLELFAFADDPSTALRILQEGIQADLGETTPTIAHSRAPEA